MLGCGFGLGLGFRLGLGLGVGFGLGLGLGLAFVTSYTPYFVPSGDVLRKIVAFFGYGAANQAGVAEVAAEVAGFPEDRLVARSPSARQLLLLSDAALSLLRAG